MLSYSDILKSVKKLVLERFVGETVYFHRVPSDLVRPSFLVELGPVEMAEANWGCVDMKVTVKTTVFVTVDESNNSHVEELMSRQAAILELLAVEGLRVGDRVLRVTANKGTCQFDYAEIATTFQYMDDRPADGRDWPLMGEMQMEFLAGG